MAKKKKEKKSVEFVEGLTATEVLDISIEDINFDDKKFQYRFSANVGDLKNSIGQEGQREPVDLTASKPHKIIDGFRRMGAIRALGWPTVKALVHKGVSDDEAHKIAFIKNVVRKNLSPMEKANAIFQAKQRGVKVSEVQEYFGLSEKQLKRYEDLLDFPSEIQKRLENDDISMAHAKVLADFKVKDLGAVISKIAEDGLSAKQLKKELKKTPGAKPVGREKLYLRKEKGGFRMYPFSMSKDSPKEEKDKVLKILKEAIELIEG